jgi:hypothetical protein
MLRTTIALTCSLTSLFFLCQPSQAETKLVSLGNKGIPGIEMYVDLNSRSRVEGGSRGEGFTIYEIYPATGELFSSYYFVSCSDKTMMEFKNNRVPLPAFAAWQRNLLSVTCQDSSQSNRQPQRDESLPKLSTVPSPSTNPPQNPTKSTAISKPEEEKNKLPISATQPSAVQPALKIPDVSINESQVQILRDNLSKRFKVSVSVFKNINVRDAMSLQSILQRNGFRSAGGRLANGKLVKRGDTMELPTIKALQTIIESELSNLKK